MQGSKGLWRVTGLFLPGGTQIRQAYGSISPAAIIGTAVGQLGHANGVEMVPAGGTHYVAQLIWAMIIMDFITAAYTGGGNVTVNIGSGGAALTGLVAAGGFITVAADKILELVPLAATINTYTENKGINLVSSVAPTNPGTAAGIIRYAVGYRYVPTGL